MNVLYDRSHEEPSWSEVWRKQAHILRDAVMFALIYVAFPIAFWFGLIALTVWIWRML